ncbi:hypothetical protein ACFX2I_008183 [Malus domestica]
MPHRFLRKQSCWGSGSRDSGSSVSSIFEKVIMLGVWLSRFGGRCLFDFGASNLVGSVFSNSTLPRSTEVDTQGLSNYPAVSDVVGAASFACSTLAENFGKVICGTHELLLRVGKAAPPSPDNIWRPSFVSPTGPLTVGDSVMKNDMTAAVVARNLLTPKDNRLLSKRSDELAVKDSLALSVQCAGSVSNMAQRLFARTRQVESLAAEVMSLKQEIRGLKHENKQLHRLAHDYATNMKRKLDQMKETDGQVLLDHQRFVGLFQRHLLPSSSGAVPRNEAPNDQPLMPPPSRVLSSTEAPNDPPPVPSLSGALPTAETSPKQPL